MSKGSTPNILEFVVDNPEWVGKRCDVFLTQVAEKFLPSRSFAQKAFEQELVRVNGKAIKASYKLRLGDKVFLDLSQVEVPPLVPEPEAIPLDILYEDEHLLVINKPAGMSVHPGAGVYGGTVVNALLYHCKGQELPSLSSDIPRPGVVHRLDKDTSGVMVLVKTQRALTHVARQFASHTKYREYVALVFGMVDAPTWRRIETLHGRDPRNRLKFAVLSEGGKLARMDYCVAEVLAHGKASLVRCRLHTGRTHQIRVQMAYLGYPLLGDELYGGQNRLAGFGDKLLRERLQTLLTRQMLHARCLELEHPLTGERMRWEVEPPADFRAVYELLKSLG